MRRGREKVKEQMATLKQHTSIEMAANGTIYLRVRTIERERERERED